MKFTVDKHEKYILLKLNESKLNASGTFILTGLNEPVARLITISQLDSVLSIVPTCEEAIDLVFMEEIEKELKKEAK